jgi:transposase
VRRVVLFEDEFTLYRQPRIAQSWEQAGKPQPRAERGHRANSTSRIIGALNAFSGAVHCKQTSRVGIRALARFLQSIAEAYPNAETTWMVVDNWPMPLHPDVMAALTPEQTQLHWPIHLPATWPTEASPKMRQRKLDLPIRLVPLPTYASWCNPIEKLWRLLRQERIHLHHFEDQWAELKRKVHQSLVPWRVRMPKFDAHRRAFWQEECGANGRKSIRQRCVREPQS